MSCPRCSAPIRDGESRCPSCGNDLTTTDMTTAPGAARVHSVEPLDLPPGTRFDDRYIIIERAGVGGMGVVCKAIDTALDLEVALKLIRPDLARVPAFLERFKQEVKLTRQIAHPNVCRVHDLGESEGILYLSMEWIEGQTLRQLLNQAGTLDPGRALEIAEKVTEALRAAHARGIVHRDLKPENVMIDDRGGIFVMDFGIAVEGGQTPTGETGAAPGTPAYMAPEQKRGERVDARADLFSLGLILVEMLSGRRPEPGADPLARLPAPVRRQFGPVLEPLLAQNRDERCASAEEAAGLLRSVRGRSSSSRVGVRAGHSAAGRRKRILAWGTVAGLALLAALGYERLLPSRREPARSPQGSPSPDRTFLAQGVSYLGEAVTVTALDDAIKMFNRALEANPRFAVAWAGLGEAYWFRFQLKREESSREEAIKAVDRAIELGPHLPEVHCARGVGYFAEGNFPAARAELQKAVDASPKFDRAWAWLGTACRELNDYDAGSRALKKAIDLNPHSFQHRYLQGNFFKHWKEYEAAAGAYRKATDLKPDSAAAWNNRGAMLLVLQRFDEAVKAFQRSLEIEQRGRVYTNLGSAYYHQGKYKEAMATFKLSTELEPGDSRYWGNLGDSLRMLGEDAKSRGAYLEAVRRARDTLAAQPNDALAHAELGLFCAKAKGDAWRQCAVAGGTRAFELQPQNVDIVFINAIIQCQMGERERALDYLRQAVKFGKSRVEIELEPDLTPLHDDPRYRKILELAG